eukprot:GGOE01049358.1.p1 GENE.GGOE01049358.1~~GGOE01049358.1.p1  ORF type:complete len:257 (-),score=36.62 GGOE01049358.1:200-946(-)
MARLVGFHPVPQDAARWWMGPALLLGLGLAAAVLLEGPPLRHPLPHTAHYTKKVLDQQGPAEWHVGSSVEDAPPSTAVSPTAKGRPRSRRALKTYAASSPIVFVRDRGRSRRPHGRALMARLLGAIGLPGVWLAALLLLGATVWYRMRQQRRSRASMPFPRLSYPTLALAAETPEDECEEFALDLAAQPAPSVWPFGGVVGGRFQPQPHAQGVTQVMETRRLSGDGFLPIDWGPRSHTEPKRQSNPLL